jgi:hypothetical protein
MPVVGWEAAALPADHTSWSSFGCVIRASVAKGNEPCAWGAHRRIGD